MFMRDIDPVVGFPEMEEIEEFVCLMFCLH